MKITAPDDSRTLFVSTLYSDGNYSAWPTIARSPKTGRLFVVFSGGRFAHVCPFGKIMMITSDDVGQTWSDPRVLYDGPLDDRDAGVLVTSKGTVLVNWFNSMAYRHSIDVNWDGVQFLSPEELQDWKNRSNDISDECLRNELGCWLIRSENNGEDFSDKVPSIANSPHGPMELTDGRLLYIGKCRDEITSYSDTTHGAPHSSKVGVSESTDDGRSWHLVCDKLPVAKGHIASEYHEFHAIQADDGRLIAQIRNHNTSEEGQAGTLQMESFDGGHQWSIPHGIGVAGYPSHLTKLTNGGLLMSYSHRPEPTGNFARTSSDNGQSWSAPFVFGPTRHTDMGYPSSVELPDKTILSVWYELFPGQTKARLRIARWAL